MREALLDCTCNRQEPSCDLCRDTDRSPKLEGFPLAMVYSPFQEWEHIYEAEEALKRGTIFKKLDLPFYGPTCTSCNCNKHGH